jgi:ABC-type antimicrobial peptide transport system permease subunit
LHYFLLLLVTSFVAGFYPSLVLSAFRPVAVLTNKQKLTGRNYLTKGLIVLQFALTIFLIIGTIAVYSQLHFLSHADLGYDNKNLVRIDIPISSASDRIPALFEQELLHQPGIIAAAGKNGGRSISGVKANGKDIGIENNKIDEPFFSTFRIPLLAGRGFSPSMASDSSRSAIVNESLAKEAGWTNQEALGKIITVEENKPLTIVGVIRDYHYTSLKEKIMPELFTMDPRFNFGEVWIRIDPSDLPRTLTLLQATFRKLVPYFPYVYQFMDDLNAKNYETENKWKQIISIASLLFIFISCIGLFGLVILSIEQRSKEIGIRKVLGAAISRILVLVAKDFLVLIALAFLVAAPVGYYFIHLWLEDFAYKTRISWWFFAGPGLLVFCVALATILFRALRAAMANPVMSLRTE